LHSGDGIVLSGLGPWSLLTVADRVLARQDETEKLETDIEKQIYKQNLSPEDMSALRLILESLRRIGEYATDIAEIVLNMTVSKLTLG
jgi:phosphate uptake regulator